MLINSVMWSRPIRMKASHGDRGAVRSSCSELRFRPWRSPGSPWERRPMALEDGFLQEPIAPLRKYCPKDNDGGGTLLYMEINSTLLLI